MWFRENVDHARQQNKLSGAFTAKVIQYLQINLCSWAYTVYFVVTDLRAARNPPTVLVDSSFQSLMFLVKNEFPYVSVDVIFL
jgi:hypothetical protein